MVKKGYKQTEEHIKKRSLALKGKLLSEEHKKKLRKPKSKKGYKQTVEHRRKIIETRWKYGYFKNKFIPWNKNLTKETDERVLLNTEKSHRTTRKLYGNSDLRKTPPKIIGIKISKSKAGHKVSEKARLKIRKSLKQYFKEHPEERLRIKEQRAKQILPTKDTSIEVKIQNLLKQLGIEFFTHQYMKIKHGYQCDILIPVQKGINQKTIIECDGDFIHCNPEKYPSNFVRFPNGGHIQPAYVIWEKDRIRTEELIENGFRVLRFWGSEIKKMELNDFRNKIVIEDD